MNGGGNQGMEMASTRGNYKFFPPWSGAILSSALAWVLILLAIPPSAQNFPLGDDWAFAHGAIWFAHSQGIHYSNWASMPQIGQWVWSWPFLHVIAAEHFALRLSAIVLSWLGLVAFYDLLRQEKVTERIASFATAVLALDPLWFISQGTYMTDVPAISFGLLALCFYARALKSRDRRWLWSAVLAAIFAVTTRQTMLAVPLAAGLTYLCDREIRWQPLWISAIALPVMVCGLVGWWFSHRADVVAMTPAFHWQKALFRPFVALHFCGLVVLPLGLLTFRTQQWRIFFVSLIVMLSGAAYYRICSNGLPYGGLFPYWQGILSLEGASSDGWVAGDREMLLTPAIRILLTALGCIGAAGILTAGVEAVRARQFWQTLPLFTVCQFLILLTLPLQLDRYLEVFFPGVIFVLALRAAAARWRTGLIVLSLYSVISVALMHDWLAWNSARWQLGRQAIAGGKIQPVDIEGGFEWNGWFASADFNRPSGAAPAGTSDGRLSRVLPFTHTLFPQVTGHYVLTFTPPAGSTIVASLPYTRWLPPAQEEFYCVQYSRLNPVAGTGP